MMVFPTKEADESGPPTVEIPVDAFATGARFVFGPLIIFGSVVALAGSGGGGLWETSSGFHPVFFAGALGGIILGAYLSGWLKLRRPPMKTVSLREYRRMLTERYRKLLRRLSVTFIVSALIFFTGVAFRGSPTEIYLYLAAGFFLVYGIVFEVSPLQMGIPKVRCPVCGRRIERCGHGL